MRFAICNETFAPLGAASPWPWEKICRFLAETGYDGVELAPFTFADDIRNVNPVRRREIRAVASDNGLAIVGVHWLLVSPPGLHIHTVDPGRRRKTLDYLRALIEFAGDVGAPTLVLGSPKARSIEDGDRAGARERTIETLMTLVPDLKAAGAVLCPEALPGPEADFLLTQSEAMEIVDAVGCPQIAGMLDVKSMCSEPEGPAALCRRWGGRVVHVHANDANRRGPGFGDTDFRAIADALRDSGYDGPVSVEVFDYSPDPQTIARESLRHLQECFA